MSYVIFLDIDGVLASSRIHLANASFKERRLIWTHFDLNACAFLQELCDEFNIKIVVSSSWRQHFNRESLTEHFIKYGNWDLDKYLHEDWRTLYLLGKPRGLEINEWLSRHTEVTNYLIIDDDSDFLPEQKRMRTNPEDGILSHHYRKIINYWKSVHGTNTKSVNT